MCDRPARDTGGEVAELPKCTRISCCEDGLLAMKACCLWLESGFGAREEATVRYVCELEMGMLEPVEAVLPPEDAALKGRSGTFA